MAHPYQNASLYVGNLRPDVTETDLYQFFNSVAFVTSTRVCRDSITRASLNYGYVNFASTQDAQRVLESLNFAPLGGQPCRLMWSQRDPALRKSGLGNIFIKNLDRSIDDKALYDTFSTFGKIVSCKIQRDDSQQSLGYGYVQYENEADAQKVIDSVNGMLINDIKVVVTKFVPRKKPSEIKFTNVYIKHLDESITDQTLKEAFSAFGEITSAVVMTDGERSRGFGFVNFATPDAAEKAIQEMDGKTLGSRNLYCARAQSKSERQSLLRAKYDERKRENYRKYKDSNLYVKNLDDSIDEARIREEFSRFGTIIRAAVMVDENKRSKGFGFVCFSTRDEATRAIQGLHEQMLGSKRVYVAIHQRREERRAHLESIYNYRTHRMEPHYLPVNPLTHAGNHTHGHHTHTLAHGHATGPLFSAPVYYPRSVYTDAHGYMRGVPLAAAPPGAPLPVPTQGQAQVPRTNAGSSSYASVVMAQSSPFGQRPARGHRNPAQRSGQSGAPRNSHSRSGKAHGEKGNHEHGHEHGSAAHGGAETAAEGKDGQIGNDGQIGKGGSTLQALSGLSEADQKSVMREKLMPLVAKQQPALAERITQHLARLDTADLLGLLEDPQTLDARIREAAQQLSAADSTASA
eukprot:TRINITY_DN213_c0_g2_i1.p1 TRINITY_DN213_c0_g2~~TRINITY_DN213_c0_g2_i1.p1  ORF type:complete len:632 (+),score=141.46 TRINITY_DN213_c0_g2_i1:62-1957(+)